jgi:hypothetical protein
VNQNPDAEFVLGNVLEYFKQRRYAAFFGAMVAGVIVYQIADSINLLQYWPFALTGIDLWLLTLIWRGFRQMRAGRLNRYKSSTLSRDEMAKAWSKLKTKPTFKSS